MIMRFLLIGLALSLFFSACMSDATKNEKTVEEIKAESKNANAKIVRNPISADTPEDTINVAKMSFEEEFFDFGSVKEGAEVEHTFKFTNTGLVPLVISNARSTCGCTVPQKPDQPVAPGASDVIRVKFKTAGKFNKQEKPIIITANTYPKETRVYLRGFVERQESADKKTATN
jgi:hypothetical protein